MIVFLDSCTKTWLTADRIVGDRIAEEDHQRKTLRCGLAPRYQWSTDYPGLGFLQLVPRFETCLLHLLSVSFPPCS